MFPDEVMSMIREVARAAVESQDAKEECVARIRARDDYEDMVDEMVRRSVGRLVDIARATINAKMRAQAASESFDRSGLEVDADNEQPTSTRYHHNTAQPQPRRVSATGGTAVLEVYEDYYNYCIGGNKLGWIMGEDLAELARQEFARAEGHDFNGRLLSELDGLVPAGQSVSDAVPRQKLEKIFERCKRRSARNA